MSATAAPADTRKMLLWAFNFVAPLLLLLLPETEAFTWTIKVFLAVTLFGIIGFALEQTDNLVFSLLMMFMYGLFGVVPLKSALMPWVADVAWMTLGALILVSVVQKTSLLQRMAYWAVIKTGGSYIRLVMGMTVVAMIARIFLQGTMACITVTVVAYGICEALKLGKSKAAAGLMIATVIGYVDTNYYLYSPDFISVLYNAAQPLIKLSPSYPAFFKNNAIFLLGNLLLAFAIAWTCRPTESLGESDSFRKRLAELGAISTKEWKMVAILSGLIVFLFTYQIHGIDMVYGFIFAPMLMYMPGIEAASRQDLKDVQYNVLFFIIACMSIGSVANAVGFGKFISVAVVPMLQDVSQTTFLFAVYILGVGLNFIMTPLAEMATFGMPFTQICMDLNFNVETMFYVFYQGCSQLWMPYEMGVYLVAYSMGNMRVRDFALIMTLKFVINTLFMSSAGLMWWKMMGLI